MERIAVVDGLTLAAVLARVDAGGRVILTRDGAEVAVIVRPDDLSDAATAYLLEAFERSGPSQSALLADLEAAPHPVTPNGRPQSPPAGVS
ncbi:MAG: hypothetical protein IT438_09920 [Phycisphaerales bacterium]|nr:hypothetical protein [Phycisphaerales bacterium]